MPEPAPHRLRPTTMTHLLARPALVGAVLALAVGCGSATTTGGNGNGSGATPVPPESTKVGPCPADSPAVRAAKTVTKADVDGDGQPEAVRLTAPDGDCPDLLFAKVATGYVTAQLPVGGPALTTAFAVDVPGRDGSLVVTRQDHPRGGFQLRVYAAGQDGLVELKVDGHTLVPFVALDVQEHPLSIDCTDGGVVLTEAVAHQPAGVAFAWDIKRTTYTLDGTDLTAGPTREVADNVLPQQLGRRYSALVRHSAFASCRAAG